MRKALFTSIIALAAFVLTAMGQAGRITGRIIGNRDHPLGNVMIMLTRASDNEVLQTVLSNAAGEFVVENLSPGNYRLHISAQGYDFRNSNVIEMTPNELNASLGTLKLPQAERISPNGITVSNKRKS